MPPVDVVCPIVPVYPNMTSGKVNGVGSTSGVVSKTSSTFSAASAQKNCERRSNQMINYPALLSVKQKNVQNAKPLD